MGAYQSNQTTPKICCLHVKGSKRRTVYMLVPLLPEYFEEDGSLFHAFHRIRDESKIRYFYARGQDDNCKELAGAVKPEVLFYHNIKRQGLQANTPHCMPLGCAVAMVVEPNANSDGMLLGHPVKILGRMACRNAIDETSPWEAGIFLHHQATEGQLKFVAVAAAAMYLKQSEGVDSPTRFRGVEFTTLQQNLSMLRALQYLSRTVALHHARTGGTQPLTLNFSKRNNRYLVSIDRDGIIATTKCLASFANEFSPDREYAHGVFQNDGALHFLLPEAMPDIPTVRVGSAQAPLNIEGLQLQLQYVNHQVDDFTVVQVFAPAHVAGSLPPDTLDDAVLFLRWIAECIDNKPNSIRPAAETPPEEMVPIFCFGRTKKHLGAPTVPQPLPTEGAVTIHNPYHMNQVQTVVRQN